MVVFYQLLPALLHHISEIIQKLLTYLEEFKHDWLRLLVAVHANSIHLGVS